MDETSGDSRSEEPPPVSTAAGDEYSTLVASLRQELDRCRIPLRNFKPLPGDGEGFARSDRPSNCVRIPPGRLPVIGSVHLVMSLLVGAHKLGRTEKLTWEFPFSYRERACSIAHEKFGLRLYLEDSSNQDSCTDSDEIIAKLSAAARLLEKSVLSLIADEETAASHLIVQNQVAMLRGMYDYFRRLAEYAYAGNGLLAKDHDERSEGTLLMQRFRFMEEMREGFYATVAMTMAYFSLLEHLLVFALLAIDFDPAQESLTHFISLPLFDKFRRIFKVADDPEANRYHQRLHEAAETWRNPYGHGGFDKVGGALAFYLPGIGPLSLLLSDIRRHPSFNFVPERDASFGELCSLFDDVDTWLRTNRVAPGIAWAEAGLDIAFAEEFLTEVRSAIAEGPEAFEACIERVRLQVEDAMNMDW